jgi:hypothetical protein
MTRALCAVRKFTRVSRHLGHHPHSSREGMSRVVPNEDGNAHRPPGSEPVEPSQVCEMTHNANPPRGPGQVAEPGHSPDPAARPALSRPPPVSSRDTALRTLHARMASDGFLFCKYPLGVRGAKRPPTPEEEAKPDDETQARAPALLLKVAPAREPNLSTRLTPAAKALSPNTRQICPRWILPLLPAACYPCPASEGPAPCRSPRTSAASS